MSHIRSCGSVSAACLVRQRSQDNQASCGCTEDHRPCTSGRDRVGAARARTAPSDYELAYRRSIDGASAERFKALTVDALDAAALAVERNREQAERDAALGAELDAALDAIDRAWRLELTTPDQDGRIVEELAGRVAAIDAGIGELREQYALIDEKLESVDYYDDDADAQLERYAAEQERIENRVAELSREREAVEDEIILYTLAYRLQRGRTFVPSSEMCPAEAAADNCDECSDAQ